MIAGRDRPALLRQRRADLRTADAAQEDGRAVALAGGGEAAGRGAAGRPGVQDPVRSRTWATSPSSGSTPARSGTAARSSTPSTRRSEKLNHLSVQQGKERVEVERLSAGDIGSVAKLKDTHTGDTFCWRESPGAAAADTVPRCGGHLGGAGEAAGRGGQARRRAAQAARGGSHLPLRVQLGAGPDADPRHGRAALRHHPQPAGAEVRGARGAGPAAGGLPRDDQGKGRGPGQAQEADRAGGASTATAGSGSRRCPGVGLRVRGRDRGRGDPRTSTSRRWIAGSRRQRSGE